MVRRDSTGDERAESVLRLVEQASRRSRWDSTVRVVHGDPGSDPSDAPPMIPADLLSDRLEELERSVNRLEWTDRQLRAELKRAHLEYRAAQRSRLCWKAIALLAVIWLVGSMAGLDGLRPLTEAAARATTGDATR